MITAGAKSIALVHTHADGTIAYGTSKGDGSAEVLKANGWRWSRNLRAWYIPHSRDKLSKDWVTDATKTALEAAGFEVEVRIHNDITRSVEERETDRADRLEARAEMLNDRAARHQTIADSADAARRQISDHIPLGQPILVGHHSEGRHRRDIARMDRLMQTTVESSQVARDAQRRADNLIGATEARNNPRNVARRIEDLEKTHRATACQLNGYSFTRYGYTETHEPATGDRAERLRIELADLDRQLTHWRKVLDDLKADGAKMYGPDDIMVGDFIYRSSWMRAIRVNKKSVTVEYGPLTYTVKYHEIRAYRRAEAAEQQDS
ncbi:DUF3560 domain-containing protein [Kribbella sp. NPDC049227]|uniref:DUF3560 domain-containing protein n=1 Tax=Kribbella sp. NPDC049227 TaxID=3364113 RepID=UPI0037154B37